MAPTAPPQPRVTTLSQVCRALADQELELYYQPVRTAGGAVVAVEALARWRHPERGMLDAATFIPAVAHTSLDATVTEWVLRQAAQQCARWRATGMHLTVSVNISARSLYSEWLVGLVRSAADDRHLPVAALELEVPEAVVTGDPALAVPAMRRLDAAGVNVCMDNFGAVYGAMTTLAEVPLHRVKVDRRFSGAVATSALARTMVADWARVAHHLGLVVTAQGVETPAAWQRVIALGCDEVQGYGICPPMAPAELTRWLAEPAPPPPERREASSLDAHAG